MTFEIGVMTFGEVTKDPVTGWLPSPRQHVRETEQARVADEVGAGRVRRRGTPPLRLRRVGAMALPVLLGTVTFHAQTVYRAAAEKAGHDPATPPISINTHGYVGRTSQEARETMYPYFAQGMAENNHHRGVGFPLSRASCDAQASPGSGLLVGSPQAVIDKLLRYRELYGISRAIIQMGFGGMPQEEHLKAIEQLGTEVAPVVRREIALVTGRTA